MTFTGADAAEDWIGCLVLVVSPQEYTARVAGGVRSAEKFILDSPVLADVARVATTTAADPLAGDLDDVAGTLLRELLEWSLSPARNPAPRSTFCLLVVHPDTQVADELVRRLAATSMLSRLPVVFRVAEAAGEDEVAGAVLDAIDVAARGIERAPEFSLTRRQLGELAGSLSRQEPVRLVRTKPAGAAAGSPAGGGHAADPPAAALAVAAPPVAAPPVAAPPVAPPPVAGARPADPSVTGPRLVPPAHGSSSAELAVAKPFVAPIEPVGGRHAAAPDPPHDRTDVLPTESPAEPAAESGGYADGDKADGEKDDGPSALGRFVGAARSRLARRVVPSSNVEIIETLSERASRVSMLYVVMVTEPVRPSRRARERRTQVALQLTRALMSGDNQDSGPWYVRTFTADRQLHPGPPLPAPDDLRAKDFPERWGAYFELFDCVGDIRDTLRRDRASFVRRGGGAPDAFVLFLASDPPTTGADRDRRLKRLRDEAVTIWMSFSSPFPGRDEQQAGQRLHFLGDHEDAVGQACTILLAEERLARRAQKAIGR